LLPAMLIHTIQIYFMNHDSFDRCRRNLYNSIASIFLSGI
jgi:hypothetical protein